jgi:hypothetical protein
MSGIAGNRADGSRTQLCGIFCQTILKSDKAVVALQ